MAYKRVTKGERILIRRWSQEGFGLREMARLLGRAASSVCRELIRNRGQKGYRSTQAHWMATEKSRRQGSRRFTDAVRADAEERLRAGWTPEIICQRARFDGRASVCKETIYKHIYEDAKTGGTLWMSLPRAHRKRHRRCPRTDGRSRGHIPNLRRIDTRPAEVETRQTVGHWEGDLINGAPATGNLITLVERNTRFTLVGRSGSKEAHEVMLGICAQFETTPKIARLSLTLDNGMEFAHHEEIARNNQMDVYFAKPYHAWERGTNENINGLIRRLHPKKSSFADIGSAELKRIDTYLNDRPMKCLGWMTPREKMTVFLSCAS